METNSTPEWMGGSPTLLILCHIACSSQQNVSKHDAHKNLNILVSFGSMSPIPVIAMKTDYTNYLLSLQSGPQSEIHKQYYTSPKAKSQCPAAYIQASCYKPEWL